MGCFLMLMLWFVLHERERGRGGGEPIPSHLLPQCIANLNALASPIALGLGYIAWATYFGLVVT